MILHLIVLRVSESQCYREGGLKVFIGISRVWEVETFVLSSSQVVMVPHSTMGLALACMCDKLHRLIPVGIS